MCVPDAVAQRQTNERASNIERELGFCECETKTTRNLSQIESEINSKPSNQRRRRSNEAIKISRSPYYSSTIHSSDTLVCLFELRMPIFIRQRASRLKF